MQLEGLLDVGGLLATLVDCHQEQLAEQWAVSLGRHHQARLSTATDVLQINK